MKILSIVGFVAILVIITGGSYYLSSRGDTAGVSKNQTETGLIKKGEPLPETQETEEEENITVETPTQFFPSVEDKSGSAATPAPIKDTNTTPKSESTLPKTYSVSIANMAFGQKTITIRRGDRITWTNQDSMGHTATADDGSFDTGMLEKGQSKTITFNTPGTFSYHCTPHPGMKATVIVQ